ncbi:acyl carrier protein [Parabacteroides sp. ZJ-118]|uniref:acyl carrier protein n=1 Tax=Parabacteroides sp. ZJ-118 TaxID=2709398 RepID=UPI0013EA9D07|nr:acyl carrier protein [Parabacteroides sp. ZJ-118]
MTNLEKYNNVFIEVFGVDASALCDDFSKETVDQWDSVHQLNLVTLAEETFDIMLDPEDIMGFTSYAEGKQILSKQDIEL